MYANRAIPFIVVFFASVSLFRCTEETNKHNDTDTGQGGDVVTPCVFRQSLLSAPTGPYCIGAVDYHWVDPDREEPFTVDDASDRREIAVRLFYPSTLDATGEYGVYLTPKSLTYFAAQEILPNFENQLEDVKVHFRVDVPLADGTAPFPVLLFSPGYGGNLETSTALLEDLASRGYVVAAVNHPYFSGLTELSDGSAVAAKIPTNMEEMTMVTDVGFPLLVGDMKFLLDKIFSLAEADPEARFNGRLDTARVGAFGHSLGGAVSLGLLLEDDRVAAGIDMDGSVGYPGMDIGPIDLPVLFHLAGPHGIKSDPSVKNFWERLTGPGYAVFVETAAHGSYTDFPLIASSLNAGGIGEEYQGTIDPKEMTGLVRDYNGAFFDIYLKDASPEILTELETAYPDAALREPSDPPEPAPTVTSRYLTMKDGTRIAADIYVPFGADENKPVPTVMRATRYWRDMEVLDPMAVSFTESAAEATMWTDAGYALVLVDARGTGASFGKWQSPWSAREAADYGEIVDWIIEQAWSNGKVGAQGISYDGNTADFIGLLGNEAVKIVAPLFGDWNVYTDVAYPGGIFNEGFIAAWNLGNQGLDANDVCAVFLVEGAECDYVRQVFGGVRPADGDEDHGLLDAAVKEHQDNCDVLETCKNAPYIDSSVGEVTYLEISPAAYTDRLGTADAPAYSAQASWMDAATVHGALSRFAVSRNNMIVYIGPWSHGGGYDADPFLDPETPVEPPVAAQAASMREAFDYFMTYDAPSVIREIQYYTLGEGAWRTTDTWPPSNVVDTAFYLRADGVLTLEGPAADEAADDYPVDFTASTGGNNRWWTQNGGGDVVYPDRAAEDEKLLTYTSAPLEYDLRITGYPEVEIMLSSTHEDGALYVYLEDVDLDGKVTYITEGQLRLVHRAVSDDPPPWHSYGPYHSYRVEDAAPMVPGAIAKIDIALQPIAVLIKAGHALRVALAGHDAANFARLPETGEPTLSVFHDVKTPSRLILPLE